MSLTSYRAAPPRVTMSRALWPGSVLFVRFVTEPAGGLLHPASPCFGRWARKRLVVRFVTEPAGGLLHPASPCVGRDGPEALLPDRCEPAGVLRPWVSLRVPYGDVSPGMPETQKGPRGPFARGLFSLEGGPDDVNGFLP